MISCLGKPMNDFPQMFYSSNDMQWWVGGWWFQGKLIDQFFAGTHLPALSTECEVSSTWLRSMNLSSDCKPFYVHCFLAEKNRCFIKTVFRWVESLWVLTCSQTCMPLSKPILSPGQIWKNSNDSEDLSSISHWINMFSWSNGFLICLSYVRALL